MPAYAVYEPQPTCSEQGCTKPATYHVKNGQNELIRRCCKPHADALVKELNKPEAR